MKNLWISIIPATIVTLFGLGMFITITIKRTRYFIVVDILLLICVVVMLKLMVPYFQDISSGEMCSFTGVYTDQSYVSPKALGGTTLNTFVDKNQKEDYLVVPKIIYAKYDLHKGNTYHITYYKNSHVVYSVKFCDGTEDCEVCRENLLD